MLKNLKKGNPYKNKVGRPSLGDEARKETLCIVLSPKELKMLRDEAKKHSLSVSKLVRIKIWGEEG